MNPEDARTLLAAADGEQLVDDVGEVADMFLVAPGEAIGRYVVRDQLGEGGMGVVYVADDPNLGRKVAIKVLRGVAGSEAPEHQRRLLREAQALARLSHPNLVAVHDVGAHEGRIWVAMEYLRGQTLDAWLETGPAVPDICRVFLEAGQGLLAAHEAGLVHRDFKPANVMVRHDGRVQVLDFGLVRAEGEADVAEDGPAQIVDDTLSADLTRTGGIMGTPAYMAPEQHLALPIDARADQFSFAVALYEALYGERPFQGDDASAIMRAVVDGVRRAPPEMDGLPGPLRDALAKGLARQAKHRHPTLAPLLAALREVSSTTPVVAAPQHKGPSRSARRAALLGLGTAALLAVGVWGVAKMGVPDTRADLAPPTAAVGGSESTGTGGDEAAVDTGDTATEQTADGGSAQSDESGLPGIFDGPSPGEAEKPVHTLHDPALPGPDAGVTKAELPGVGDADGVDTEAGEVDQTTEAATDGPPTDAEPEPEPEIDATTAD